MTDLRREYDEGPEVSSASAGRSRSGAVRAADATGPATLATVMTMTSWGVLPSAENYR